MPLRESISFIVQEEHVGTEQRDLARAEGGLPVLVHADAEAEQPAGLFSAVPSSFISGSLVEDRKSFGDHHLEVLDRGKVGLV